jgi:hypothetical protein
MFISVNPFKAAHQGSIGIVKGRTFLPAMNDMYADEQRIQSKTGSRLCCFFAETDHFAAYHIRDVKT